MAGHVSCGDVITLQDAVAAVAEELAHGGDAVEDFELSPLRLATGAVVIFFLLARLVEVLHFLGEVEDAVFDGVDSGVEVDVIVVFADRSLLAFAGFLSGVTVGLWSV